MFRPATMVASRRLVFLLLAGLVLPSRYPAQTRPSHVNGEKSAADAPTAVESPDIIAFRHLVRAQASREQKTQFDEVARTMGIALEDVQGLRTAVKINASAEDLSRRSTALRDAVYDAQHENFLLLKSLSDTQEQELKKLTTKVRKANEAVGKASDALNDEVVRRSPDNRRVSSEAGFLYKELSSLQSAQRELGDEMGVKRQRSQEGDPPAEDR